MNWLASHLLAATDWSSLRSAIGTAGNVPAAVESLASAASEEKARTANWRLDNRVVVQGRVFQSALPLVPVLLALVAGTLSSPARKWVLDLLYEIGAYYSDPSEDDLGNSELGPRCKAAVAEGKWVVLPSTSGLGSGGEAGRSGSAIRF